MNKIESALVELVKANLRVKEINKLIGDALQRSADAADDHGSWNPINKNKWLLLAYKRESDQYESYFANHEDDVEGFLEANCVHALQAHRLIQERKPLRKAAGIAKRRVSFLANRLHKESKS